MPATITIEPTDILLAVDLQLDFMPGGALAVDEGDVVVPLVNALMRRFPHVVLTQDWHPPDHASFASTHGAAPFETKRLGYGDQTLWPDHCVQGTSGAALHPALETEAAFLILRKGMHPGVDSYSAFVEADGARRRGSRRCYTLAASSASSAAGSPPTSASPIPPSTPAPRVSTSSSSKTPAGRSTPTVRWRRPGRV